MTLRLILFQTKTQVKSTSDIMNNKSSSEKQIPKCRHTRPYAHKIYSEII